MDGRTDTYKHMYVSVCAYVRVLVYACVCMYTHTHIHTRTHARTHTHTHTHTHVTACALNSIQSASVAQLDARPNGDQEIAGSTPAVVGNILSWRLIMKYFLRSFSPFADSRRAVVSFWRKNVHNTG